jgi:hypothetical protein
MQNLSAPSLWNMPEALDGGLVQRASTGSSGRDAFDQYQAHRSEAALETQFFFQSAACARQPALGLDSLVSPHEYANLAMGGGPQCLHASPELLAWQRKEQAYGAGRGADTATGPAVDAVIATPSMGWSDALDTKTCSASAGSACASAPYGGRAAQASAQRARRLASGISVTSTSGSGIPESVLAMRRALDPTTSWMPTSAAFGSSDADPSIEEGFGALVMQQRTRSGGALPAGLYPGHASR